MARGDDPSPLDGTRREAAELVKLAAGPRTPNETTKTRILRAARALGWAVGRTEDIWRGEARRIEVHEMDRLRALQRP